MLAIAAPPLLPLNVTTLELTSGACRYPVGEAAGVAQLYCGHPIRELSTYCPHHHAVCWRVAEPKAKRDAGRRQQDMALA